MSVSTVPVSDCDPASGLTPLTRAELLIVRVRPISSPGGDLHFLALDDQHAVPLLHVVDERDLEDAGPEQESHARVEGKPRVAHRYPVRRLGLDLLRVD